MPIDHTQVNFIASLLTDDPEIVLEAQDEPSDSQLWDQITQFVQQPVEAWAELVDVQDASMTRGAVTDPGDYPSAMGSGPRAARPTLDDFDMVVVFKIDPQLAALLDRDEAISGRFPYDELFERNLQVLANQEAGAQAGGIGISWSITRRGDLVTFTAADVDTSSYDFPIPEPGDY